ncbi:MAG TPA: PadR family transcriptional regulator [Acidobacteriota bacterium]|nr:PadR family transcriptional regulator [Acidobacteriota bacterium]
MSKDPAKTDSASAEITLSPVEFQILLALAETDCHGYGIMQRTEQRTRGSVNLEPGNLYRALARLLERGLVERCGRQRAPESGMQRRRYYRITARGRQGAAAQAGRMAELVEAARRAKLVPDPEASS